MNDSNAGKTTAEGGDTTGQHGGKGHNSDIPEDSPASESDVSLSQQVADREPDSGKDT
ncbi:hypothetical protein [Actinomycetospora chibensis]|uniref:Uncharacterized protein n=1 Tax=Actinomycetospora chibensis TaxID=663606 RepID=A0ABV9RNA7_9PSEU|nr:hypothetical protein [Actinomycetospora chibensis]MDD7926507.1 hypothetical protein [Actinomycetospora chibensis]